MRILVADDALDARLLLARILGNWGYDVVTAENGSQAWDILNREPIRLVISDWLMPESDGMELCRRIRGHEFPYYTYVILLTGSDEKSDIVAGLDAGADDFLTKPFNRGDLRARVRIAQRILDLKETLVHRNCYVREVNTLLQSAYDRIRADLSASRPHKGLLLRTEEAVPAVYFDWLFRPASAPGGDIFNFFVLDRQHLGFYHLEMASQGIPAAMLSVTLSRLLSHDLCADGRIADLASAAADRGGVIGLQQNALEHERGIQGNSEVMPRFTAVQGILNRSTGRTIIYRAGHPSPIRVSCHGSVDVIDAEGLSVVRVQGIEIDRMELALGTGDRLFLFSNGIRECERADGQHFGGERLQLLLAETARIPLRNQLQELEDTLTDWRGSGGLDEGGSVLAIQFRAQS